MAGVFGETPGKIRSKIWGNTGMKIRKIRGTFVLQLFWPKPVFGTLSGTLVRVFQSRGAVAISYIALCFSCIAGYRAIPPKTTPRLGVSQDNVGSMPLASQLKLPSRSYHAIGGIAAILSWHVYPKAQILKEQKPRLCQHSVQTWCIVKGEAQKSPLFWGALIFSGAPVL